MTKPLNVALIGCGFMGRTHSNAYCQVNHLFAREYKPVLKVACARVEERDKLEKFAQTWGYESMETDWRKAIARPDVDLVDVCVPNSMHHDIVIAAAEAGKMIVCEHTFINGLADFLASLEGGPAFQPDIRSALRTQRVCDAVLESAKQKSWVEIPG